MVLIDELRDRILNHLCRNRVCVISTSGIAGAWAVAAHYSTEGLKLDCCVPRWSDVVYYLEQDPHVTAIVVDTESKHLRWLQYHGIAHITHSTGDRDVAIRITPQRIDLIDESRGWGVRETLDI